MPEIRFFRDRKGHNIAYSSHGEGPLVICPAWWVSNVEKDWDHAAFRAFFTRLGEGLTLVRYDRPGVGLSDRAIGTRNLQDEADLLTDLAAEIAVKPYSLFAFSNGGPPALVHAATFPETVERLCLYGSYADGPGICTPEVQQAMLATIRAHWGMGSRAMADIFLPDEDRASMDDFARQQRDSADVDVAAELLELTYAMDARASLPGIAAETLILHRRKDRAIPPEASKAIATGIANARLLTLDGSAHLPWVDGDGIASMANAFLRGEQLQRQSPPPPQAGANIFDPKDRCLMVDGTRIPLTPLEFGVLSELTGMENQLVTRDHLLEKVWNQPFEGSNRIDSLMRGLRRKLGPYASCIETVTGHGYRFTGWKAG